MKAVAMSLEVIRQMPRPATYIDELRACVIAEDERGVILDADSPCYQALLEKYRDYQPTPQDLERTVASRVPALSLPSRGLGDTIAKILERTGIAALARRVLGRDCGCERRRETLNAWMRYRSSHES
jgi:hypothetical protein